MSHSRSQLPCFLKLRLTTMAVAIGERVKKGTFRPCIETIPTSTLMGCFHEHFGLRNLTAIGFFEENCYQKKLHTYAPFDSAIGTAKLPLVMEYLAPRDGIGSITGNIYVASSDDSSRIFNNSRDYLVSLGALRSKGFGQLRLRFEEEVQPMPRVGYLKGNLRESDASAFGIDLEEDIISPNYGFLFRPDVHRISGQYERALFAGTILEGPEFLIGDEYQYDR